MGPDGNAVFFLRSKFELVKSYHRVLEDDRKCPSNATVLVVELEHKESRQRLAVFVTHLKAKKGCEGIREAQTRHLLELVKEESAARTLLVGDFNAPLQVGVESADNCEHDHDAQEPVYGLVVDSGLVSAYSSVMGCEPEYTTWKVTASNTTSILVIFVQVFHRLFM